MKRLSIPLVLAAALASLAFQAQPPPGPAKSPSPAARPSPTPPPQLEGIVKGPDGKPVDKALVIVRVGELAMGEAPLLARTDAAGRFQIRLKAAAPCAVRVEAAGLAATKLEKVRPGAPLTITLGKGGAIEGMVRDSQNAPVPKARVVARDEGLFAGVLAEPEAGLVRATSDAKGYFRLEGLGPGLHTVTARARGAGSARRGNVRVGSRVDLLLMPGATVFGRVTGARAQPVAGATVMAEREERFMAPTGELPVETTDAMGQFELLGLAPGTYSVIVQHKDYAPGMAAGVAVDKEASARADIALAAGLRMTGRLVGAEGRPVPGKVHVQEVEGRAAPRAMTGWVRADAGPDGRFNLPAMAGGSYVLAALGSGHTPQRVEVSVPATGTAPVDVGDVMLEVGLALRGRVRDKAGAGLEGANLRALPDRPFGAAFSLTEGQSEADGRFVLAGLNEGTYRVTARLSGYAEASQVASTGGEAVEIVLNPGGTITGQVVDETNRPIDSFGVDAEPSSRSGGGFMFRGGRERVVDPDGRFTLDGLSEGSYVVRAETPEMVAGSVSGVKVTAGQTTDVGRIRLSRGGIVRGSVVDSAGAPVPGAAVFVRGAGNEMTFRGDAASITSDGAGLFEARGVPLGKADVLASHPNYAAGRVSVEVEASKATSDARVVLTQGGRIEGWARKRDGTPLAGRVQVTSAQMMGDFATRPAMVPVGADGSFVVEHVPPGRMRVLLMQGTPNQMMSMMNKEVEVREGETTSVELTTRDILITGRVTRGGVPQPSLRVNMRMRSGGAMVISMGGAAAAPNPPSGPQRGTAVTREDGSYELLLDDAGEAMTRLESLDGKISLLSRTDTIPDVDSHVLDFALTGVVLSGVVIDKVTEKAVDEARVFAAPKGGERPNAVSTQTGPDGRFTLEVEPGDVRLRAAADGYAESTLEVNVGQAGLTDVRLDLGKGLAIEGRIVDAQGRAVPGIPLFATSTGPRESRSTQFAMGLADGSFRLDGLASKPHTLLAGSARAGFAFRAMVAPGAKDVALTLQPGGKVRVRVLAPDGQPAERTLVTLQSVGGVPASMAMGSSMTDSQGITELDLPAGAIELEAHKGELRARQTVNIAAGGAASLELTLKAEGSGPRGTP